MERPIVFISYATPNLAEAEIIRKDLEVNGLSCWIANRDILEAEDYRKAIIQGFDPATVVIVLISADALNSPHVKREVDLATNDRTKVILPIRLEAVDLKDELRYSLSSTQRIDAFPSVAPKLWKIRTTVRRLLTDAGIKVPPVPVRPIAKLIGSVLAWLIVALATYLAIRWMHQAWFILLPFQQVPGQAARHPVPLLLMLLPVLIAMALQLFLHFSFTRVLRLDALFAWTLDWGPTGRLVGSLVCIGGLLWTSGHVRLPIEVAFHPGTGAPEDPALEKVFDTLPLFHRPQAGYYSINLDLGPYLSVAGVSVKAEVINRTLAGICAVWISEGVKRPQDGRLPPQVDGTSQYVEIHRSEDGDRKKPILAIRLMRADRTPASETLVRATVFRNGVPTFNAEAKVDPKDFPQ